MPTCHVVLSEVFPGNLSDAQLESIRDVVAEGLDSRARSLDRDHVVIRVHSGIRAHMLGEVEVEIFCQFFLRRFFDRDRRANKISSRLRDLLGSDVATWVNMGVVGYSRVTTSGRAFYSD